MSGQTVTIVGVAPEGFGGSLPVVIPDVWLSNSTLALHQGDAQFQNRGARGSLLRGRLADGASLETVQAQLDGIAARLR